MKHTYFVCFEGQGPDGQIKANSICILDYKIKKVKNAERFLAEFSKEVLENHGFTAIAITSILKI